ncbi:class I SAM-dependent methyltransferase [Sphingomonas sp. SM33]|uniref:Class I SAM-dependent methyltransferase n=1 Tax=Sphingomonas telluris TaxID=2907998 RepID=A0ABS9VJH0_9SPHN|nr:class I SAM-dependent methyltransferase [Sphingomonas telluris]
MGDRRFYEAPAGSQARRSAPAALRNREPIADVLRQWLPESGTVLEVASGTGEHAVYFAERFPGLDWQASDTHPDALASLAARRNEAALPNLLAPVVIDASQADWPVDRADAVLNINMAHISPWSASLGLIAGATRVLETGGPLILYGPWLKDDLETAPSNVAFDAELKRRDSAWGLRRVEDFADAASRAGFVLAQTRQMPANNLMLLFRLTNSPRT